MSLRWEEREALKQQYPEFYVELLFEVVELVDRVDRREVSAYEGTALAKARFAALMAEHLPECQARVSAYQERVTAERRKLTLEAAQYEEKRQASIAGEKLRLEKEAADRNEAIFAAARAAELKQRQQWQDKHDEAERMRHERNEKDRLSAEAAAKEGARLLAEIETSGKGK